MFKDYQKCLTVCRHRRCHHGEKWSLTKRLQVALQERGIDKLVEEARDDNKDNDALYLGRKCRLQPTFESAHCANDRAGYRWGCY